MQFIHLCRRLLVVSRPIVWLPTVGLYYPGVLMSADAHLSPAVILGLIYFTLPVGIVIYGLNDIYDRDSDAHNSRKGASNGAVVKDTEIRPIIWAVWLVTLVFAGAFAAMGNYLAALGVLALLALSYVYSVPPLRCKSRAGLDLISSGSVVLTAYVFGFFTNVQGFAVHDWPHLHVLAILLLCAAAVHAILEVLDYEVDKQAGDRTITVVIGKRPTLVLCAAFFASCFVLVNSLVVAAYFMYAALLTLVVALFATRKAVIGLSIATVAPVPLLAAYIAAYGL